MLTRFDLDRYVYAALAAGAGGFLLKDVTPKTHVARIFAKLDLRDRAQAVVLAYETGLVAPGDADR
jgi:DNA-binding NarL/FixJ family response regulator